MGLLPTEKNVPVEGMPKHFKLVVAGKSKSGKTIFAASFPDVLLIECEKGGAAHTNCHVFDVTKGQNPLKGLRMGIVELASDTRFKTIAVDTVDAIAEMVAAEVCRKYNIPNIFEGPAKKRKGVQWEEYTSGVTGIIGAIVALQKNVIVLGHNKPATRDEDGNIVTEEGLDIYGKASRVLYSRIDNIAHMTVVNDGGVTKTMMSFKGGIDCTRGSRHPALRDKEILVPKVNGYAAFEKLFHTEAK